MFNIMLENKDTHLKKIDQTDIAIAHSQFFNKVDESFADLEYDIAKSIRKTTISKPKENNYQSVFFDFETNTNQGSHKQHMQLCDERRHYLCLASHSYPMFLRPNHASLAK